MKKNTNPLPDGPKNDVLSRSGQLEGFGDLNAVLDEIKAEKEASENTEPDISCAASATECTGLMPTPPENGEELDAYQELFGMEIPKRGELL